MQPRLMIGVPLALQCAGWLLLVGAGVARQQGEPVLTDVLAGSGVIVWLLIGWCRFGRQRS